MLKKWNVSALNKERAMKIAKQYDLPAIVAMLLDIRSICNEEDLSYFLYEDEIRTDPSDFKDMNKACERLRRAVNNDEKICIYGDYDADGITATALLYSYLSDVGANVIFYIPSRKDEGYGMNRDAVRKIHDEGVNLIVTVDNGIAAIDEIRYASELGMDTIVTDHHMPGEQIPDAFAVVDAFQKDCPSRYKDLCGVGMALMLVMNMEKDISPAEFILDSYSDLAALGTIGDIVPVTGDNRVIIKHGLEHINMRERPGIAALLDESGYADKNIEAGSISYTLIPRINAGGRLSTTDDIVSMLLSDDDYLASATAKTLGRFNLERKQMERDMLIEIDEMIKRNPSIVQNRIIVISGRGWHQGVIGVVASKIKEVYEKPTIIISVSDDGCRGSGRSVEGFPLSDVVFACSDLLIQCGGHQMAVGFEIREENIESFIAAVNSQEKVKDMPLPSFRLDCKLNPEFVNLQLCKSLDLLEPYGAGNKKPVFGLYSMYIRELREIGAGKHIRMLVTRGNAKLYALKFNTTRAQCPFNEGDTIDLAVTLEAGEYNGIEQLSLFIRDYRFSDIDVDAQLYSKEIFESFCRGNEISSDDALSILPDRNDCVRVYKYLRANNGYFNNIESLLYRIGEGISYGKLRVILEIMSESGLIEIYEGMFETKIVLCEVKEKVDLMNCEIVRKLREVS